MAGLIVDRNRGQLLLVGALTIAVLVLGLGAVLNTAVVTEELAANPDAGVSAEDALRHRHAVRRGVGGTLAWLNRPNVTTSRSVARLDGTLPANLTDVSHATLRSRLRAEVGNWSELTGRLDAVESRSTSVSVVGVTNGSRIAQYEWRSFTNQTGVMNWTVADDVGGVREFRMNVSKDGLENCDNNTCFQVLVENASATWKVTFRNTPAGVNVTVAGPGGTQSCVRDDKFLLVDLTRGTLDGEACPALSALSNVEPPFDIRYRYGENVVGRYELLVDTAVTEDPHFAGPGGPEVAPAIYAADVRLSLRTDSLAYRTTIRVAPGELDA